MTRVKRAIYTFSLFLSVIMATVVAAQPASAASWSWYYDQPVFMGLYHTGKHVAKATVEMTAPGIPTTLPSTTPALTLMAHPQGRRRAIHTPAGR
jgi:hypothetical protein